MPARAPRASIIENIVLSGRLQVWILIWNYKYSQLLFAIFINQNPDFPASSKKQSAIFVCPSSMPKGRMSEYSSFMYNTSKPIVQSTNSIQHIIPLLWNKYNISITFPTDEKTQHNQGEITRNHLYFTYAMDRLLFLNETYSISGKSRNVNL